MKNSNILIRTVIILIVALVGIYLVFGPRQTPTASDFTLAGIQKNLSENINLGLDLKGGSHLVMRVDVPGYLKTTTENTGEAAIAAAKAAQLSTADGAVVTANNNYSFTVTATDAAKVQEMIDAIKAKVDVTTWSESRNGANVTWTLPLGAQRTMGDQAVEQALKIIESRLNSTGVKEPTLQRIGAQEAHQILLQMPGVDDPERIKKLLNAEARLELMKVVGATNPSPMTTYPTEQAALQSLGGNVPSNRRVLPVMERNEDDPETPAGQPRQPTSWAVVENPAVVDGNELRDAIPVSRTGNDNDYQISFSLKPAGAQKFGAWTGANVGAYMAVVLNNQIQSAPYIKSQIFDSGEISGTFTKASADDLVLTLKSGALPATIKYEEERTIGPSLGADSIAAGVNASIGGLIFVIVFMLLYYRGSGVNAVVALLLNTLLTMAGLIVFDATLTLPGIAGLILGIGMAVDSNVLIFERIREELRAGNTVAKSIELGFDRAFITIVDTHITTIISSIILYMYGSSLIKGFAVTLILGLVINLFTAVFVSKTIYMWLLERKPDAQKLSI